MLEECTAVRKTVVLSRRPRKLLLATEEGRGSALPFPQNDRVEQRKPAGRRSGTQTSAAATSVAGEQEGNTKAEGDSTHTFLDCPHLSHKMCVFII